MKKNVAIILMFLLPLLGNQNYANYSEEELVALKERALNEASQLMMQEIFRVAKDIQLNSSTREELVENLCSTAAMNTFTVNADISDELSQNPGDFSGSIFVSRDNQASWFSSDEVSLIGTPGYENTWETSVGTSGGDNVDWYLSGLVNSEILDLNYGTLIVSQAPNNINNNFPPLDNLYATIVEDETGDTSSDYDIQKVSGSFSSDWDNELIDRLFISLDLNGNCCEEGGLFGPWYLYGVGIVNPESDQSDGNAGTAYALGYGSGGFGQLSPGLLKISGDLASGEVGGFEYLPTTYFNYSTAGDKLKVGVNAGDLFNDPDFGVWPNSLQGLVLLGVTVEVSLSGVDIVPTIKDQTDPGIMLLTSQHQEGNYSLMLADPAFNSDNNLLSVTYLDLDNNLPWYRAAQICDPAPVAGEYFCYTQIEMIPESHTYSEGVIFNAEITQDLIDQYNLSGEYTAHFWFADSDDIGEAQIVYGITIGEGGCALLGDSNGDGLLNVLDVVLSVNLVLSQAYELCADINSDGTLNVLDIVTLVNAVLAP